MTSATSIVCVLMSTVPPRVHELPEEVLEEARALGVEADHRLVDHDHLRAVHQRARDDQLLAHAVAVGLGELALPGRQLEQLEQLVDAALDRRALVAVERRGEAEELPAGELVVDERPVGDVAEPRLGLERARLRCRSPPTITAPLVGRRMPAIIRIVVVFPAPLGPSKPNSSPRGTSRSMPSTAVNLP